MAAKGIEGLLQACLLLQSRLHLCLMTVSGACMQCTQCFGDLDVPEKQYLPSYTCLSARKRAGCHALQQIGLGPGSRSATYPGMRLQSEADVLAGAAKQQGQQQQ